jgi:hypothetical protein
MFELAQKLYLVTILVEGFEGEQNVDDLDDQGGDDKRDSEDKDNSDDEYDGLDDFQDSMETDQQKPMEETRHLVQARLYQPKIDLLVLV